MSDLPRPCETRLQVFFNGRDPEIAGRALTLPRRELRILEYMVGNHGKWITKTQIFNAAYGIFESTFDETRLISAQRTFEGTNSLVESAESSLQNAIRTLDEPGR